MGGATCCNHYLTSYLLAIAIKYTYVGAGILLQICTLNGGGAVLPAIRNGLASLCMDGSVGSLGAIDNSYIFEYNDQLVAPAVPFVLMSCCLFTCCLFTCCCFFYKSFGASFSQQSI